MDQVQQRLDAEWETSGLRRKLGEPTLKLLGRFLAKPDPELWKRAVFTHLVGEFDQATMTSPELAQRFATAARAAVPEGAVDFLTDGPSDTPAHDAHVFAGRGEWRASGERSARADPFANRLANLLLAMPPTALQHLDPDAMWAAIHLHDDDPSRVRDDFRAAWNEVLRAFNLLQFLPLAWWTTRRGIEENLYDELPVKSHTWVTAVPDEPDGPEVTRPWVDALRFADETLRPVLVRLRERGLPPPEAGYELSRPKGRVLAEAELGWEDHRIAVLMTDQSVHRVTFESHGWRVLSAPADDLAKAIADLLTRDSA